MDRRRGDWHGPGGQTPGRRPADAAVHRPPAARARAQRVRRRSPGVERVEARGDPDGLVRGMEGSAVMSAGIFRPGMRGYFIAFGAGLAVAVSAFLPWVVVDGVGRPGFPDVVGLWIAGLGVLAAVLAMLSLITRRNSRHPLLVVGLAALGIM